jgi:hypothetical protein
MRIAAIAITALLLASCAGDVGSDICYKTVRSPTGKGPRALAVTACALDRQALAIDTLDLESATAG